MRVRVCSFVNAFLIRISLYNAYHTDIKCVCTCVRVCARVCARVCRYTQRHACTCVYVQSTHSRLYLDTRTMHMGACMHALMKMCANACVFVRVRAGMRERERESERESARAHLCGCMGVRVCV